MASLVSGISVSNGTLVTPAILNAHPTLTTGTIVDADISSSAAIADTKLATISTAGKVSNSATTAASANTASAIVARDASGNFTAGTVTLTGNLIPAWIQKSGAYTALSGDLVATNTYSATWILTLPASPATGTQITVSDASRSWDSKNLTIARNGSTIESLSEDLICDAVGSLIVLFYNGSTWRVLH
jgi:hypothetical protein